MCIRDRMYSMDNDIDHILVSEDALQAKVNEMGAQISRDYAGKDLLLVSICLLYTSRCV